MSVWFVRVFVVEAFNKFPESCWVGAEVDVFKYLFPESCLFCFNVGVNFCVEFLYSCNSVGREEECAKVSACLYFMFDVAVKSGVVAFDVA